MENNQEFGSLDSVSGNVKKANQSDSRHSYRMIVLSVLVFCIALGVIVTMRNPNVFQKAKTLTNSVQNTGASSFLASPKDVPAIVDLQEPWVRVQQSDQQELLTVGQESTFVVEAYSKEYNIAGYDLLLTTNNELFEVVSVTSVLDEFTVQTFPNEDHTTITGYKNLQSKQPTIFEGTPILTIVLKAKQEGSVPLYIESLIGKEKTQFIEDNSEATAIFPQSGGVMAEIVSP